MGGGSVHALTRSHRLTKAQGRHGLGPVGRLGRAVHDHVRGVVAAGQRLLQQHGEGGIPERGVVASLRNDIMDTMHIT